MENNIEKMQKLELQMNLLLEKYKKEKEQVQHLKDSISKAKEIRTELFDIKQANRKKVDDLKKELDILKNKQNTENDETIQTTEN